MNSPTIGQAQIASRLANETVAKAVRQWKNRLLQMDRRNSLLYFDAAKRGVPLADVEPDKLLERLSSSRSGLAFAYAEKLSSRRRDLFDRSPDEEAAAEADEPRIVVRRGDIESTLQPLELQKRLAGLAKRNREWVEEQGLSVLYVAIGTLNWLDEDQVPASSPVLLVPCELSRQSPRDPFYLVAEDTDDVSLNATLRHKLTLACGIELPEVPDGTVEDYLNSVRRLIAGREGCSVDSTVVVATFPFSKLAMWEDLNRMSEPGAAKHPLVRRLGGDGSATAAEIAPGAPMVPADDAELAGARLDDLLDVRDQYAVVDADFSQLRAIEMVRSGRNLVIHGPPGTGKSQTIANIIATLLAERKRVLFVSEKKAALDVVKRRLNEVGLGSFCLDLHSDRAKKASVYAQLRDFGLANAPPAASFPFDRLIARREELNALVRELHRVREPLGLSVFQVHARLAEIGDRPRLDIESSGVSALTSERLREIEDAVGRIKLRPVQFREHHTSHWRVLQELDPSPRMPDLLQGVLARLKLAIDQVAAVQNDVDAAYEFGGVESIGRARSQVRLLTHLADDPGQVCEAWLQREGRSRAVEIVEYLSRCIGERARLQAIIAAKHSRPERLIGCAKRLADLGEVAKSGQRFERARGREWDREALRDTGAAIENATLASDAFRSLAEAHAALCGTLDRSAGGSTRRECDDAVAFAHDLLAIGPIPRAWLTREAVAAIQVLVIEASELADTLASAEAALEKDFGLELIDLVDRDMLVRYRTDHRSVFGWMHKAYWRDRKTLRACMRQPRRLSLAFAQDTVALALRTRSLRDRWEAGRVRLSVALEHLYEDRRTDWGRVLALLKRVLDLYAKKPELQGAAATVLISAELLAAADLRSTRAGELRTALTPVWPETEFTVNQSFTDAGEDAAKLAAAVTTIRDVCDTTGKLLQASPTLRDWTALFETGRQLEAVEADVEARTSTIAAYIGTRFRGWETTVVEVKAAIDWTGTLNSLTATPIPQLICEMVMGARTYPDLAGQRNRQAGALAAFDASWQSAASYLRVECLSWPTWDEALVSIASKWCDELIADSGAANDWLDYCAAVRRLDTALAIGCTAAVRNATEHAAHVPGIVLRHVFLVWLDGVYALSRSLQIAPRDLAAVTQEFRELDRKLPVSARDRVRSQCTGALSGLSANQSFGEMGVLNHQLTLRRKQLPVRKLVERIPNLLPTIKPCFMMSPLAVSQYLPRGNGDGDTLSFDAVIFDEASQVFPEDAVPSIARARQCVVVGDQQQLPPTSFFRSEEEEGDDKDESEESGNRLENVESILDALVGMRGAGVSDVYLQVHYRSQHDNLIRYSNHYFYEDRLLTFPSAHGSQPGHGVRSVYLPEGRFEAGGSRTNRKEAERVVELVYELMASQPANESIGVVALSRAQADLIQQLVDQRRLSDRRFDERFADEARERLFVKNLENVQGDERDHVLLSIGYGLWVL